MKIPKLHYISRGSSVTEHIDNILKACSNGAELVQLRLKNYSLEAVLEAGFEARRITSEHDVILIINDHYKVAKQVRADGVHLGKNDACPAVVRRFLGDEFIIGGTANTKEDCEVLINKNVDYIGLGPYRFTQTKKNLSPLLGINGYRNILSSLKSTIPIIAIGGITLNDIKEVLSTGVFGIAASGEISDDFQKIQSFKHNLRNNVI